MPKADRNAPRFARAAAMGRVLHLVDTVKDDATLGQKVRAMAEQVREQEKAFHEATK